jgi:hypothetical protein
VVAICAAAAARVVVLTLFLCLLLVERLDTLLSNGNTGLEKMLGSVVAAAGRTAFEE